MSDTPNNNEIPEGPAPVAQAAAPAEPVVEATQATDAAEAAQAVANADASPAAEAADAADAADAAAAAPAADNKEDGPANLSPAAVAALLAERFPALFGAGRALPIKLRIQADIQQRAPGVLNKKSLSVFLHRYTTSTAYLKALSTQPNRLDLDGAPAGEIEAVHKEAAAAEVLRRKQMFDERRAAERDAQRKAAQEARRGQQRQAAQAAPGEQAPAAPATEGGDATPQVPHAPHTPRPPRADRPPRGDRNDRNARNDRAPGPPRGDRAPRPDRPAPTDRPPRADRPDRGDRNERNERPARPPREAMPAQETKQPVFDSAENEARRSRATLLRSYETTTLTRANFCALKGMAEADLQTQLDQARQEREQRPPQAPRPEHRPARDDRQQRPAQAERPRRPDRGPR
jgi:ProP effector